MVEPLLTPKQVAVQLLVSEKTVLDWLRRGRLPRGQQRFDHLTPPFWAYRALRSR